MKFKRLVLILILFSCFLFHASNTDANTTNKMAEVDKTAPSGKSQRLLQLSSFKEVTSNTSINALFQLVGSPNHTMGKNPTIYIYNLRDGSQIWIGSQDSQHILYVDHVLHGQLDKRLIGTSDNTIRPASTVPKVSQK